MAGERDNTQQVVVSSQARLPQPWEKNPYHPLFLHHSDQTSAVLIPIILEDNNYQAWQEAISDALEVKNKACFLDGTQKKPAEEGEELQQWRRCNTMVKHWLLASMSKEMHKSVSRLKDAKDIWDELKERFTQTRCLSAFQVEEALHKVEQGSSSVTAYYTKLKTLWDEREFLIVVPPCRCDLSTVCTCANSKALSNFLETQKIMKFLVGLNESFAQTRNNITAVEPMMPLNMVYAMVLRHEKQAMIQAKKHAPQVVEASAFATKKLLRKNESGDVSPQQIGLHDSFGRYCEKCKQTSHSTKYCRPHIVCSYCNRKGHSVDYCRTKRRQEGPGPDRSNAGPRTNVIATHPDFSGLGLTPKDCDTMLAFISKVKEASRDASDDNHLLEMMRNPSANVVGYDNPATNMSGMMCALLKTSVDVPWIIDSGATDHIVHDPNIFTTCWPVTNQRVRLPNGVTLPVTHVGTVCFTEDFQLHSVLCVPTFSLNLISVMKLALDTSYVTIFIKSICVIQDLQTGKTIGTGAKAAGLYCLNVPTHGTCNAVNASQLPPWHARHPSAKVLSLFSFLHNKPDVARHCSVCPLAKQTRTSFPSSQSSSISIFDLIHVDIWGGYRIPTVSGAKYFLTIVDDHSRSTWLYLLHTKSEARTYLQNFLLLVETQFDTRVKVVRSDNGPEFRCPEFYSRKGILHQTSCVNTPQQNGVVERKHRHLQNVTRALLFQSRLPLEYWGDAILTATYLINRTPTPLLHGKTPFEKLFNKPPHYDHLRVFGCKCFASTHPSHPGKFDPRSTVCVFLGYPQGQKGYTVMELATHRRFISRDVIFHEDVFPSLPSSSDPASTGLPPVSDGLPAYTFPSLAPGDLLPLADPLPATPTLPPPAATSALPLPAPSSHPCLPSLPAPSSPTADAPPPAPSPGDQLPPTPSASTTPPTDTSVEPTLPPLRRSSRVRRPPRALDVYRVETTLPSLSSPPSSPNVVVSASTAHPLSQVLRSTRLHPSYCAFLHNLTAVKEPQSYHEARLDPAWVNAMNAEVQALQTTHTWTLQALPPGKTAIGCKWVYKVKLKADGSVERLKARLVAKGSVKLLASITARPSPRLPN